MELRRRDSAQTCKMNALFHAFAGLVNQCLIPSVPLLCQTKLFLQSSFHSTADFNAEQVIYDWKYFQNYSASRRIEPVQI